LGKNLSQKQQRLSQDRLDTFKNLRDEFDPCAFKSPSGLAPENAASQSSAYLDELKDVSDDALLELVDRILKRDEQVTAEAIDALAVVNRVAYNVAERLLTGPPC